MKLFAATLVAATLFAVAPRPASALVIDTNCQVRVDLLQGATGVYAVTTITSRFHLAMQGDLVVMVNGQQVKTEPVATSDQQFVTVLAGGINQSISCCVLFKGTFNVGSDNNRSAQVQACAFRVGDPGFRSPPIVRPVSPTDGLPIGPAPRRGLPLR